MNTNTTTTDETPGTANVLAGSGQETAAEGSTKQETVADGAGTESAGTEAGGTTTANEGDAAKLDGDKPKGEGDEPEGAPEAYAEFTLPEGVTLEAEGREQLESFGKKHNLSQSAAQEAVDLATAHVQRQLAGFTEQHTQRVQQWAQEAKADPLVGGNDYDKNVQMALSAVGKYGDDELKAAFEEFGLGNHPAFIRFAYRIGKADSEGQSVDGMGAQHPGKPLDFADRMYAAAEKPERGKRPVG